VAASGAGSVEAVYADENVWLSQRMMGQLYDVETHTINYHLKKVFADSELQEDSVIRNFRITAADGKSYDTQHYNLAAIIASQFQRSSAFICGSIFLFSTSTTKSGHVGEDFFEQEETEDGEWRNRRASLRPETPRNFRDKTGASARSSPGSSVTSCSKNDDWHASLLLVPASPG
jgi:hypothetical protein